MVTNNNDNGAELQEIIRSSFLPNSILVQTDESEVEALKKTVPLVESKRAMKGKATAYVCIGQACKKPTSNPVELKKQLAEVEKLPGAAALPIP